MLTGANAFGTGPADRPSTHRRFHITDHGDTDGHSCRATFTRAAGQFDLSIGINIALASVVAAKIVEVWGWPMWLGAAVALSTLVGAVIGTFVTRVQVHSLIASLGVATVLEGVNLRITDGRPIIVPEGHELEHTPVGGRLHAVGVNASAAHLSGIGVNRMVLMSFACSGLLAGLAGVLQMTRSGGNPQTGPGLLLPVFAAAFLGSTVIKRTFNVWGTVIAVLGLAFTVSGLTLNGAKPYVELWFNGAALLIAVSFTALISRLRGRRSP